MKHAFSKNIVEVESALDHLNQLNQEYNKTEWIQDIQKTESLEYILKNIEESFEMNKIEDWELYIHYSRKFCPKVRLLIRQPSLIKIYRNSSRSTVAMADILPMI